MSSLHERGVEGDYYRFLDALAEVHRYFLLHDEHDSLKHHNPLPSWTEAFEHFVPPHAWAELNEGEKREAEKEIRDVTKGGLLNLPYPEMNASAFPVLHRLITNKRDVSSDSGSEGGSYEPQPFDKQMEYESAVPAKPLPRRPNGQVSWTDLELLSAIEDALHHVNYSSLNRDSVSGGIYAKMCTYLRSTYGYDLKTEQLKARVRRILEEKRVGQQGAGKEVDGRGVPRLENGWIDWSNPDLQRLFLEGLQQYEHLKHSGRLRYHDGVAVFIVRYIKSKKPGWDLLKREVQAHLEVMREREERERQRQGATVDVAEPGSSSDIALQPAARTAWDRAALRESPVLR
ncbi:hypothetical protein JCM8547_000020 [Rhodosporidiobolus lusitaniae]